MMRFAEVPQKQLEDLYDICHGKIQEERRNLDAAIRDGNAGYEEVCRARLKRLWKTMKYVYEEIERRAIA